MHSRIRTTAGLSALLALLLSLAMEPMARARDLASQERQLLDAPAGGIAELLFTAEGDDVYESTFVDTAQPPAIGLTAWNLDQARSGNVADDILPLSEPSSDAPQDDQPPIDPELFEIGDGTADPSYDAYGAPDLWFWKVMPNGVIYHSYMAGVHEPRMAFVPFYETEKGRTLWDATLGGRAGVLRYGNCDPYRPQGWQLDMEGAVMVRLDVENRQDLDGSDYRFGFPITYGIDNWQIKFGG